MSDERDLKPTQFRLSAEDLAGLETIREHIRPQLLGREPTRADALRYAVRAAVEGIEAGRPKKGRR